MKEIKDQESIHGLKSHQRSKSESLYSLRQISSNCQFCQVPIDQPRVPATVQHFDVLHDMENKEAARQVRYSHFHFTRRLKVKELTQGGVVYK